jgi:hypothetical protein
MVVAFESSRAPRKNEGGDEGDPGTDIVLRRKLNLNMGDLWHVLRFPRQAKLPSVSDRRYDALSPSVLRWSATADMFVGIVASVCKPYIKL